MFSAIEVLSFINGVKSLRSLPLCFDSAYCPTPFGRGNIKLQGMGIFFLVMPLAQTRLLDGGQAWLVGYEYMCFVCGITP